MLCNECQMNPINVFEKKNSVYKVRFCLVPALTKRAGGRQSIV